MSLQTNGTNSAESREGVDSFGVESTPDGPQLDARAETIRGEHMGA